MKAKEKARELVEKFRELVHPEQGYFCDDYDTPSKKAALIAVEEIINSFPLRPKRTPGPMGISSASNYWHQVKEEIQSL